MDPAHEKRLCPLRSHYGLKARIALGNLESQVSKAFLDNRIGDLAGQEVNESLHPDGGHEHAVRSIVAAVTQEITLGHRGLLIDEDYLLRDLACRHGRGSDLARIVETAHGIRHAAAEATEKRVPGTLQRVRFGRQVLDIRHA